VITCTVRRRLILAVGRRPGCFAVLIVASIDSFHRDPDTVELVGV